MFSLGPGRCEELRMTSEPSRCRSGGISPRELGPEKLSSRASRRLSPSTKRENVLLFFFFFLRNPAPLPPRPPKPRQVESQDLVLHPTQSQSLPHLGLALRKRRGAECLRAPGPGGLSSNPSLNTECVTLAKCFVFLCLGFLIRLMGITITQPLRAAARCSGVNACKAITSA